MNIIKSISFKDGLESIDTNLEKLIFYDLSHRLTPIEIESDKWSMEVIDFNLEKNAKPNHRAIIYSRIK
jgi:hypothetical protein